MSFTANIGSTEPNKNGRFYSMECLEKIGRELFKLATERRAIVYLDAGDWYKPSLNSAAGILTKCVPFDRRIDDGKWFWTLQGTIDTLGTPTGGMIDLLRAANIPLSVGIGGTILDLNDNNAITNIEITHINLTLDQ